MYAIRSYYDPFKSDDSTPINLTASFGVATFPVDAGSKTELVRLADKAMYAVKDSGRNGRNNFV